MWLLLHTKLLCPVIYVKCIYMFNQKERSGGGGGKRERKEQGREKDERKGREKEEMGEEGEEKRMGGRGRGSLP